MKIATWNVNSIRVRLPHLLEWVKDADPDIILLQEIKCVTEAFPYEDLEHLYNIYVHGQKTYNGVAILSKYPMEDIKKGVPSFEEDPQARYIEGLVMGKYRIASVYIPNGAHRSDPKFQYKMMFLEKIKAYLSNLPKDEVFVLGGDFNIVPTDQDAKFPEKWLEILGTPEERDFYERFLELGLINPHHQRNNYDYTWWDYRAGSFQKDHGAKIDHFLISSNGEELILDASVDKNPRSWSQPSDHTPVLLEIDHAKF